MNVGDYVRFYDRDWTEIGQIVNEVEDSHLKVVKCRDGYYDLDNFIKSSPNIIDLIEKNDLVVDNYGNIYVVDYVFDNYAYTTTKQGNIVKTLCDYQIKSIVTKEMYSSMEYKVGE